jgi:hypothetical protein
MESQAKMHAGVWLIAGTIFAMAGIALALASSGLYKAVDLQRSWPVILIALALAQLAMTMRSPRLKGWGLLLLGDWFLMNTMTDWVHLQFMFPLLVAGVDYWIISDSLSRTKRSSLNMDRHVL